MVLTIAAIQQSGMSFTIQTPGRQYIIVSSEAHIRELSEAKEDRLSLVATADEVCISAPDASPRHAKW